MSSRQRNNKYYIDKNKYFSQLHLGETNIHTISGTSNLIEGPGRACILLPKGTKLIDDALYSSRSRRNLLRYSKEWLSYCNYE